MGDAGEQADRRMGGREGGGRADGREGGGDERTAGQGDRADGGAGRPGKSWG